MKSDSNPVIQPANRVGQVKEYYFSRRLREVARLNAEGRDIVSLGIGGPDRPPHPDVVETLCQYAHQPQSHSYQPSTGIPQLREAFARWYDRHYGVSLNPATEIQPLIGSKEGILHISLTFLNPGDAVLVPNPGYPTYTSASKLVGARVVTYDLTEANAWHPDFDALERMDLTGVKLMWINYPHMPTGAQPTRELFDKTVDFGRRHGIVIAHDNPYSFILNETPMSILASHGARDICLELNSLSKSHNMAGWRMAMVASNPQFIQWLLKVKSNVDSGQFHPMMQAAATALDLPDEWYTTLNATYRQRRNIAEKIMNALGCQFDPAQRGLFLWGRIPDECPSGEALADRLLYEARVFIAPGFIFGPAGDRFIRISLCANEKNLERALERIIEFNKKSK